MEHAASTMDLEIPARPLVGTLPTRLLEPLMLLVPGTEDVVVVVDGGLLTYAHQLAKAVAQALPFSADDRGEVVVQSPAGPWPATCDIPERAAMRFNELMIAVITGNAGGAPPYLPEPHYESLAAELCDCMELFVVAREYARLIERDHLRASTEPRRASGETFQALRWNSEQEIRADALGLALTLAAAAERGDSLSWAFFGVDLLLSSFAVLERALPILTRLRVAHPRRNRRRARSPPFPRARRPPAMAGRRARRGLRRRAGAHHLGLRASSSRRCSTTCAGSRRRSTSLAPSLLPPRCISPAEPARGPVRRSQARTLHGDDDHVSRRCAS